MRIKIFCEDTPDVVEASINRWLEANPGIEITQVTQSQIYSDQKDGMPLTISILYRETAPEQARTGFTA